MMVGHDFLFSICISPGSLTMQLSIVAVLFSMCVIVPHFAHIRRQLRSLYQHADGTMQCFMWNKDQKAVCHCLATILDLADDTKGDASS